MTPSQRRLAEKLAEVNARRDRALDEIDALGLPRPERRARREATIDKYEAEKDAMRRAMQQPLEPNAAQVRRAFQLRTTTRQVEGRWVSGRVISTHATLEAAFAAGRGKLGGPFIVIGPGGKTWPVEPKGESIPNAGYYVWVMGRGDEPLDEPALGPHDLEVAKQMARIAATKGVHDRAVSRGLDPLSPSFKIVRRYRSGTGERVI